MSLALTHKRARFTACLLDTLVNAALRIQQTLNAQPAGAGRQQDQDDMADIVARIEIACLQSGCNPTFALAQTDACMPVLCILLERLWPLEAGAQGM